MKRISILIMVLTLLSLTSCGTLTTITASQQNIEIYPKADKDELYVKANLWMVDVFNDAESVIQFSDKEAGVFKGKYLVHHTPASQYSAGSSLYATLMVNVKDNYLKLTINIPEYQSYINSEVFVDRQKIVNQKVNYVIQDFKDSF